MIAFNVNAGLANQMFHYAFGRGLINKGYDVFFDQINFRYRKEWIFENIRLQDAFPNIEIKEMPKGKFKWICIHETNKVSKGLRLIMINFHNLIGDEKYIFETDYGYISDIEGKITKNCILKGFWQSEKYFAHCKDDIRKQFSFLPFDEKKNIAIMNKMKKENSVAIHLRKGADYLQSELPGEYAGSVYTKKLRGMNAKAKANAVQILPEMIEIASNGVFEHNRKAKHARDAKMGWYRYDTRFALPVYNDHGEVDRYNIFTGRLLIRHASSGKKYLYDVLEIKKETSKSCQA